LPEREAQVDVRSSPEGKGVFYDRLEVRAAKSRDKSMLTALPGFLHQAIESAPAVAVQLKGIDPDRVTSFAALAKLPVLRKSELVDRQAAALPFGGLNGTPVERLAKIFMSPGPIFEPEGTRPDYWRFARAMFAAGIRTGDLIHNSFAYHLTPAGAMVESGARALGCPVIAAGTAPTEKQIEALALLRPVAFVGTPSFLKTMLERSRAAGQDAGSLRKALVSGEAFPPALAEELERDWGIAAYQCYATADLGLIAYETPARDGLVIDEEVIVEIVRPGTGDPLPQGEVGEVVVTVFNPDYPLIRFATGDLSAIMPGPSPCGRTNRRLRGWLGRADQTTKVKGMFVHPGQIAKVAKAHPEIGRARLVVDQADGRDRMTLRCEVAAAAPALAEAIAASLRAVTGLAGEVELVAAGSLANDGKVIDDRRALG
jgi:phenylacetate-CoA ligase